MDRLRRAGWRTGVAGAVLVLVVAATAVSASLLFARHSGSAQPDPRPSIHARFAALSGAHSNRCGMPASALYQMPPGSRLQGSCCFPMDYGSYVNQVQGLTHYAAVDVIPRDPYDIPVRLAKRLISYESIQLTPAQQKTYDRAKPLSVTNGPCCCPCWRWTAFGGQAKYLITRRHYTAKQVADVWTLEEGCGGPSDRA